MEGLFIWLAIVGFVWRIISKSNQKNNRNRQNRNAPDNAQPTNQPATTEPATRVKGLTSDIFEELIAQLNGAQKPAQNVTPDTPFEGSGPNATTQNESAEGYEFHTDFTHTNEGLRGRSLYTGSLPPPDWALEGECDPVHDHGSLDVMPAVEVESLSSTEGMDMHTMRQAIVWSEVLKRPRPGVAPRYR